jgi:hypothetical protein
MPGSATIKSATDTGYLDELLDWTQARSFPISIVTDTTSGDRSVHTNRTIAIGETILDIPLQFMITQYAFHMKQPHVVLTVVLCPGPGMTLPDYQAVSENSSFYLP